MDQKAATEPNMTVRIDPGLVSGDVLFMRLCFACACGLTCTSAVSRSAEEGGGTENGSGEAAEGYE